VLVLVGGWAWELLCVPLALLVVVVVVVAPLPMCAVASAVSQQVRAAAGWAAAGVVDASWLELTSAGSVVEFMCCRSSQW
jgi:hypothetical protein